jgi:hypothetical protein
LIALFAIFTLSFFSLTTITFSTQNAQAYTSPLCGPDDGSSVALPPATATTVTYGGKKFEIIGYNKNGNEVGVAGPNNSVTLLLEANETVLNDGWNSIATNVYQGSTISITMNTYALSTSLGIIGRTLSGDSANYGSGGYNEDRIAGPTVYNQNIWLLSPDEASHLILSTRISHDPWWLRSPGDTDGNVAYVSNDGYVVAFGDDLAFPYFIRPALYLALGTAEGLIGAPISNSIPIGACTSQPNVLGIDYVAETVTGLDTDAPGWSLAPTFVGLSTPSIKTNAPIDISSNISNTASNLYYFKASMNTDIYFNSNTDSNGVAQESKSKLIIPARPAGPSELSGVAPSDIGASDGKITGTSNKMEYSTDEVSWTAVGGSAITGLTSGTYYVRTIADQSASKFKSFATEVIVKEGSSPSAGKPGSGNSGTSVGDGGFSSEGTAQTGVDLTGLELLVLLMLAFSIIARRSRGNPARPSLRAVSLTN